MAFKPKKSKKRHVELDSTIKDFLLTGKIQKPGTPGRELYTSHFFDENAIKKVWLQYRKTLLADWIKEHPCTRPWGWWEFDDPISEPRERLGGKGQTMGERYPAWKPHYEKGIPASWYEIDPDDPPRFESEAAYLLHNDILTEAEKQWLKKHPEAMEPERVLDER